MENPAFVALVQCAGTLGLNMLIKVSGSTWYFNPYLRIVDKKSTSREYGEALFVDKNPPMFFLKNSKSIFLPSETIQQKFFW